MLIRGQFLLVHCWVLSFTVVSLQSDRHYNRHIDFLRRDRPRQNMTDEERKRLEEARAAWDKKLKNAETTAVLWKYTALVLFGAVLSWSLR